jgi:hypothetical protein
MCQLNAWHLFPAFVHRTFVGDAKRNYSVELKSPTKENPFIRYIKGDSASVEFMWGSIKSEFHYCRLDSTGELKKYKIEGSLTEQQRSVLIRGHLARVGAKLYGCLSTEPDELVILPLPLK